MKVATYFELLVVRSGSSVLKSKYYGRLIQKVADFLSEGKISIRTSAKRLLFKLVHLQKSPEDFLNDSKRFLTSSQYQKVQQIVGKGPDEILSPKTSRNRKSMFKTSSSASSHRDSWSNGESS